MMMMMMMKTLILHSAHYHKSSQENVFSGVRPSVINIYGTNIHHVHDCALLKRFSRSGVKGQGHDQSM